jgi:hypothetical protein
VSLGAALHASLAMSYLQRQTEGFGGADGGADGSSSSGGGGGGRGAHAEL